MQKTCTECLHGTVKVRPDQRLRSKCRACHRISAMMHLKHLLALLMLLGWQVSMIAPEALLGASLADLPR
jgi:hypothetical protein